MANIQIPLVSVGVLSYNSSQTILETLESIYYQSYLSIELVISDDCSSDDTIKKCNKWLIGHSNRFQNVKVICPEKNTGTCANMNRMVNACTGEWLKIIAADDILLPNCISTCVDFSLKNPTAKLIVGKTLKYLNAFEEKNIINNDKEVYSEERLKHLNGDLDIQKRAILSYNFIEAPALFLNIPIIRAVGGYDEEYFLMEDWPMNKKFLDSNNKCYFIDDYIVGYRMGDNNVFNNSIRLFSINFLRSEYKFLQAEIFPHHNITYKINRLLKYKLCVIMAFLNMNSRTIINRAILRAGRSVINFLFRVDY